LFYRIFIPMLLIQRSAKPVIRLCVFRRLLDSLPENHFGLLKTTGLKVRYTPLCLRAGGDRPAADQA
jgi:hypothetical protein